jgi:anaerobic selenocysteine-containing dehydrogenase
MVFDALERAGREAADDRRADTQRIEAALGERVKAGFCLGGNLYGSNPDAAFAAEALSKLDLVVYLNTTLNTGHAHGLARETIILPVLARDEEPQPTTQESMFNYVRLSDGGPRHMKGAERVEIIAEIAERSIGRADRLCEHVIRARSARRSQGGVVREAGDWADEGISDLADVPSAAISDGRWQSQSACA